MRTKSILSNLQSILNDQLPGSEAQKIMSPGGTKRYYTPNKNSTSAAVLILLYPDDGEWHFVLMKRRDVKEDKHAGQISLPGGRYEDTDENLAQCALRETEEEMGIDRKRITILGSLTHLYVFASDYMVYPHLGYLSEKPTFYPDKREVERVIEVNLNHLMHPGTKKSTRIDIRGTVLEEVPYYDIDSEIVWGATAMILGEFLELWRLANEID